MPDRHRRPSARRCGAASLVAVIVALIAVAGPGTALGDGDPASDVLVTQNVFVPIELSITRQTDELQALLSASARAGFAVRVAMIDSRRDLGTVTSLWRQPVAYSRYLGTELSLAFRGQVVVVMPNGIGVYPGAVAPTAREQAVAARLPAPGAGAGLVGGAIDAIERLAQAQGHPVTVAGLPVTAPRARAGGTPIDEWIALGAGAVLIGLAWAASFHARALSVRHRGVA